MDDRLEPTSQHQRGPDPLPFTSGNDLAPFQRPYDPQAAPQRTTAIMATTLGLLLLIALAIWLLP